MRVAAASTPPPPSAELDRRTVHVAERWPRVHVASACIDRGPAGHCARAVVHLGGLAPADVRVELQRVGTTSRTDPESPAVHRMFSSHGYDNGSFVFEAPLHSHESKGRDWSIRVHPTDAGDELAVEFRFRTPASRRGRPGAPP